MPKIRIATFNCENLFSRYRFKEGIDPQNAVDTGFDRNDMAFRPFNKEIRSLTGKALREVKADVICLQEVEDRKVLQRFRSQYLGGFRKYPHTMLVDGNDPRFIDVAVLSKLPLVGTRSYTHRKVKPSSRSFIFSRDCLEVDIDVGGGEPVTLYGNHFKSMIGGRSRTKARRLGQVKEVRRLIEQRFGAASPGDGRWVVLGDFNDYLEPGEETASSLPDLVTWLETEDVIARLPEDERWTHFYSRRKEYRQLDYILVSRALSPSVGSVKIERRGMPKRAERFTGKRFPGVGQNEPKASDHCPVVVELNF